MGIRVDNKNFVWKTLDLTQAVAVFSLKIEAVFIIYSDNSNHQAESLDELKKADEDGLAFGLEVGYVSVIPDKSINKKE